MPPTEGVGILAGGGRLPRRLVDACRTQHRPVCVVALIGHADPETARDVPHLWARLGAAGAILAYLRHRRVGAVVMAGSIRRPSWWSLRPDLRALRFLWSSGARRRRDDGLLSAIAVGLEGEGYRVIGPHMLVDDLLCPSGQLGAVPVPEPLWPDIAAGVAAARAHGAADIGQAVIVGDGRVVDRERRDGTDALIRRAAACGSVSRGPILVKTCKPQQDRRVDLPTIGPATVAAAQAHGLVGIVVEAGATLIVDRDRTVADADRAGIFLFGHDGPSR